MRLTTQTQHAFEEPRRAVDDRADARRHHAADEQRDQELRSAPHRRADADRRSPRVSPGSTAETPIATPETPAAC